jgi:hypothetical protein
MGIESRKKSLRPIARNASLGNTDDSDELDEGKISGIVALN